MNQARRLIAVAALLAAVLAIGFLFLDQSGRSNPFETPRTRLFYHASKAGFRLGLEKAASSLMMSYHDSYLRDLESAAASGRFVKKVVFTAYVPIDYGGIALILREWAAANQVQILFTYRDPEKLAIFVRASDAAQLEDYLNGLSPDELNPFE